MDDLAQVKEDHVVAAILDALLTNTTDAVWILDPSQRLVSFNRLFTHYCRELLGVIPQPGMPVSALMPKRKRLQAYWADLGARTLGDRAVITEGAFEMHGVKRYFAINSTPARADDVVVGAVFAVRDVTEFRRRRSHDYFKLVLARLFSEEHNLDTALGKIIEEFALSMGWDLGVIWLVDRRAEQLEPEAIWTRPSLDASRFRTVVSSAILTRGHGLPGRVWMAGEPIWFADITDETVSERTRTIVDLGVRGVVLFPIRDSREVIGVCEFMTTAARPIDAELLDALPDLGSEIGRFIERHRIDEERKLLQVALFHKSQEWTTTFDAIDTPILVLDLEGTVLRVNRAARDLAGTSEYMEVVRRRVRDISSEPQWRTIADLVDVVRETRSSTEFHLHDETTARYWDMSADYARSTGPGEEKVIVVMRDITRLVELQESVRRGEQLSAMGELVAGVAHEVRNPLFGISATLDALEMTLASTDEEVRLLFNALRKWVSRLSALMEQLLEYGKAWSIDLRPGSITEVVQQAIEVSVPILDEKQVSVELSSTPIRSEILLDTTRLVQVFQNVIMNAVQHSPNGSKIAIRLAERERMIECEVQDEGAGFDVRDLPRIFQPFFTRRRGGTGLGLSIVQRVVDEHGGTVTASNAPNRGAILRLTFPVLTGLSKGSLSATS